MRCPRCCARAGDVHHPIGHPGGALGGRPFGDGPLDPRTSYGTSMPTYDESMGTRPTPGTNDFG